MNYPYGRTSVLVIVLVAVVLSLWTSPVNVQAQESVTPYVCFPTCSESDARFMAIAGTEFETLAGDTITVQFGAPSTEPALEIGIFDGNTAGMWDQGLQVPLEFTLYADPAGDMSGTQVVGQWLGDTMPDNAWHTIAIDNAPEAKGESGHYFYYMLIRLTNASVKTASAFKLRVKGTLLITPRAFAFLAQLATSADLYAVYPHYPDKSVTTYDGSWSFHFWVPSAVSVMEIWNGDLDFGSGDLVDNDTDDPDTPNDALPPWAQATAAVFEGVAVAAYGATGDPPDDARSTLYRRNPSVIFDVISPLGEVYHDANPSGNLEWERFSIDTAPFDPALMDYHADVIPAGLWTVRMQGLDLHNLSAWRFSVPVLGEDEEGQPVLPLNPYLVGDTVWSDSNANGIQDEGELGIAGVLVQLLDDAGAVVANAITDANGHYTFGAKDGVHTIQITPENFAPDGVLNSMLSTTGGTVLAQTIAGQNVLTYDFGFHPLHTGGYGCTPGYWKQKQHFDSWVYFSAGDLFDVIFSVPYYKTLLAALGTGGGAEKALGRHATAALLNTKALGINYLYTEYEVITMVQQAYATGNFEEIQLRLATQNEMGCPLN